MDKQLPELNYISELRHWLKEQERILYEYYATQNKKENMPKLSQAMASIKNNIQNLTEFSIDKKSIKKLKSINDAIEGISDKFAVNIDSSTTDWSSARASLVEITLLGKQAQGLLNNLIVTIKQQITSSTLNSNKQLSYMSLGVLAFNFVAFIIAIIVGYFVKRIVQQNNENRRLALFIEKSPMPIAAINWAYEIEFENHSWRKEFSKNHGRLLLKQMKKKIKNLKENSTNFEYWRIKADEQYLEVSAHKISILNQCMIYVNDVSERVKAKKDLEFLAFHHALTGLENLKKLEMDIEDIIENGRKSDLHLFVIGLKRLKQVTTIHGHVVSDALIQAWVLRIQKTLSQLEDDFSFCKLYHFNGAKFVIVLSNAVIANAYTLAIGKLNQSIKKTLDMPLQTLFGEFHLDFQMGCALFPEHGSDGSKLLKNANAALVHAQNNNATDVILFDQEIAQCEQNRYQLESDLRALNFEEQLFLTYQPKVDLISGELVGVEALVRWNHPEKGLISPVDFIPIAEESGLIIKLGEWVFEKACLQAKKWHDAGLSKLQMAVNVSPSQLLTAGFSNKITSNLKIYGLKPEFVEIEITEEVLATEQENCKKVLKNIRNSGISIAVDDFGTGYSSLGYLTQFPLSMLKIDRSFITDINTNDNNLAIVDAIIALSRSLGIKVIAEGIETEAELMVLKKLECHQGQGYLFAQPLTATEFSNKYL